MNVIHLSYSSAGGAGRAGRRASLACAEAGLSSTFAFIDGEREAAGDICFVPARPSPKTPAGLLADTFHRLQWGFVERHRTAVSNTLFSIAYPGADIRGHRLFETAEIIHLHWPTWALTPRSLASWLDQGRTVFWTLHDCWPLTGGCHYPAGCTQYQTECIKCPQLRSDNGLVSNSFLDKLVSYGERGNLNIVTPSQWMSGVARASRVLRGRPISVVRNPVELDVFAPRDNRDALRAAFGVAKRDLALVFSSFDVVERRKGIRFLLEALRALSTEGSLGSELTGRRVHLLVIGKSASIDLPPEIAVMNLGTVDDDDVMADVLSLADAVCIPSLEDNYPNLIIEALACGTPCICTPVGGMPEMIEDGETGLIVSAAGSIEALKQGLIRFIRDHFERANMRIACRVAAVARNAPKQIGLQLQELYEAALKRSFMPSDSSLHQRVLKAFAKSPVALDCDAPPELLTFPLNAAIVRHCDDAAALDAINIPVSRSEDQCQRLISVRTYHDHHSGSSGPYQFLRHLSRFPYSMRHLSVPLGAALSGSMSAHFAMAGKMLGVPVFGQQGNAWIAEAEVLIRCASERIDLVHFIDGELGGWLLPSLPQALFKDGHKPVTVATYHQPPALLRKMVNARLLNAHDGIIALCNEQASFLKSLVGDEKVFVVPHGIDTEFFHPRPDPPTTPRARRLNLLLVGHWLRDIDAALEAFRSVILSGLDAELTIISANLVRLGDERIKLRSRLSDVELREAYWSADLVFIPLVDATANNAILEAMACGRPIVSTRVGGVAEAVGSQGAILCEPGDVAGLTSSIMSLAFDPSARDRLGRAARSRAELYNWVTVADLHHHVYQTLLLKQSRPVAKNLS